METIKPALHHVTFKTTRIDEMVSWYRMVVGLDPTFRDDNNAWTTNDQANHRIAFLTVSGLSDDADKIRHNGIHHSAFEYNSFSDLMSSFDRLKREGIVPAFCLDHGVTISLYYKDPEGNFVELQSDNFGDWKKSTEWMRTSPDFKADPIGTFFDPDKVFQAHAAGRPFASLHSAMRAGDFLPATLPGIGLPTPASVEMKEPAL